jgi:hypothetical protein
MNPGIYITVDDVVTQYQIDWSYTMTAQSGYLQILVNGGSVVYATGNNSGYFLINPGDYVTANVYTSATSPLIAESTLYVYDSVDGVLYNSTSTGIPTSIESYGSYYPSGNGSIDASSVEY